MALSPDPGFWWWIFILLLIIILIFCCCFRFFPIDVGGGA